MKYKIKDNVDLKELKEFGFRFDYKLVNLQPTLTNITKFMNDNIMETKICIGVCLETRKMIGFVIYPLGHEEEIDITRFVQGMIQADLVEVCDDTLCDKK